MLPAALRTQWGAAVPMYVQVACAEDLFEPANLRGPNHLAHIKMKTTMDKSQFSICK